MDIEKKAITEEDVHNWKRRRLRVAKSAESLINLPNRDHRLSRHFDDFPRINSCSGIFIRGVYCYGISVFYTDFRLKIRATDLFRKLQFLLESES